LFECALYCTVTYPLLFQKCWGMGDHGEHAWSHRTKSFNTQGKPGQSSTFRDLPFIFFLPINQCNKTDVKSTWLINRWTGVEWKKREDFFKCH
jgi:hypothetical protein